MKTATTAARMLIRITGVLLILLGLAFWAGRAINLVPLHMLLGLILVLSLWTLAGIGFRARVGAGLAVFAVVWGLVVLWLGMAQRTMLPGSSHWVIQVLHLLLGLGAMGLGESLAGKIGRAGVATHA